jgi:hypothetical protein
MADSTEEVQIWEKEFTQRCDTSPAAKMVWKKIEDAQLAKPAKHFLYHYHAFKIAVPDKISDEQESTGSFLTRLMPGIQRARKRNAREALLRDDGKMLLAIIRAGAKAHGVELSAAELLELADAAHPSDPPVDKNVLQRFFDRPNIIEAERNLQTHFDILIEHIRRSEEAR